MDVDLTDEQVAAAAQQQAKRPSVVPVDDAHPFDLESYISGYTGMSAALCHTQQSLTRDTLLRDDRPRSNRSLGPHRQVLPETCTRSLQTRTTTHPPIPR